MGEEQQHQMSKLLGYDFVVKYKPGKQNNAADALYKKMYFTTIVSVQVFDQEGIEMNWLLMNG